MGQKLDSTFCMWCMYALTITPKMWMHTCQNNMQLRTHSNKRHPQFPESPRLTQIEYENIKIINPGWLVLGQVQLDGHYSKSSC